MTCESLRRIGKGRQVTGIGYETGIEGLLFMEQNTFECTMHVMSAERGEQLWHEPYNEKRWLRDCEVITRGAMSYLITHQQVTLDHYYVWVRRID